MGIMSSGRVLPSAAARARASCDGSKTASCRKRLTLCMVMRAVGEDEMMIIGKWCSERVCQLGSGFGAILGHTVLPCLQFGI